VRYKRTHVFVYSTRYYWHIYSTRYYRHIYSTRYSRHIYSTHYSRHIYSTRYSRHIFMKLEFSRQSFEKYLYINFYCCTVHVVTIISFIPTHAHFFTL
jgi:hypothetical protein